MEEKFKPESGEEKFKREKRVEDKNVAERKERALRKMQERKKRQIEEQE